MSLVALVAALLIEQWRPLADRRYLYAQGERYARLLEAHFNAEEAQHGAIAWLLAVLPAVLATWVAYVLAYRISPVLGLLFNVAALYVTMGFRQRSHYFTDIHLALKNDDLAEARRLLGAWLGVGCEDLDREAVTRLTIEEALTASHRYVFGVMFWFMLLPGPSGAILYRIARFLNYRWNPQEAPQLERLGHFARDAFAVLDWLPARFTATAFATMGNFEDAVYCWRTQASRWQDRTLGVILASGAGAMAVRLGMPILQRGELVDRPELGIGDAADIGHLDATVGLVWRALLLWLSLIFLLSVAAALS